MNIKKTGALLLLHLALASTVSLKAQVVANNNTIQSTKQDSDNNFITLTKKGSKVLARVPVKYLGQEFLFGATVTSTSDADISVLGKKTFTPIYAKFKMQDSVVLMKSVNSYVQFYRADSNMKEAVNLSYTDPSLMAFKVEAKDKAAVTFDISALVAKQCPIVPILPKANGAFVISAAAKEDLSVIKSVKSFEDNASVKTELSYVLDVSIMGIVPIATNMPYTTEITYSFLLLPKEKMTPRIADSRVGNFAINKIAFTPEQYGIEKTSLVTKWDIEPKDAVAYANGQLTEPKKPIVFYIDNNFPEEWKEPVRKGILRWNKAFEKIGYKDAVQAKYFPTNDSAFDPDNIKYNCIRYVPTNVENAMGPSWIDPTTGEILSSSVFIFNNLERLLYKWRFIQTGNVDASVRGNVLPKHILDESLEYAVAHEVGHSLGYAHNMVASTAYPTDSLRSATFTKQFGTTPTIMDYARFNYVAQPEDKGVSLTPPFLGVYDYYITDWTYRYNANFKNNPLAEAKALEKMVDDKAGNPLYRFIKEQNAEFDPTCKSEDLGDDAIKSSNYGIKNLNVITKNFKNWIKEDEDTRIKGQMYMAIMNQYVGYLRNVLSLVGGIHLNESKESSAIPRYKVLPKAKQKEALLWYVDKVKNFKNFSNPAYEKTAYLDVSYFDQMLEFLTKDLFSQRGNVLIANHLDENSYTLQEYFNDVYAEIFKSTTANQTLSSSEKYLQKVFVNGAVAALSAKGVSGVALTNITPSQSVTEAYLQLLNSKVKYTAEFKKSIDDNPFSFGRPSNELTPNISFKLLDYTDVCIYGNMLQLKPLLEQRINTSSNMEEKTHYQLLLIKVKKALGEKK